MSDRQLVLRDAARHLTVTDSVHDQSRQMVSAKEWWAAQNHELAVEEFLYQAEQAARS
jgi:hypothetical protein